MRDDHHGRRCASIVRGESTSGSCGPPVHVVESFLLEPSERGTRLNWRGELGTDFWVAGALVGRTGRTPMGSRGS